MADVFLSYRNTEERRKLVGRLATILRAHGISVWWDYGLEAGESYRDQIVKALSEAHVVVPVWCEQSASSKWVSMEAELGKDKLLPVRLQRVAPPPQFEAIHAAHLEEWDGSILDPQLDEFIRDLCKRLGKAPVLPPDTRAELAQLPKLRPLGDPGSAAVRKAPPKSRAPLYVLAGLAVAAVIAAGAWFALGRAPAVTQVAAPETPAEAVAAYAFKMPNDPLASRQWYLLGPDKNGIGALDYSQRTGALGEGVTIAVLSPGIYRTHTDLVSVPFVQGADLVSEPLMANDGDGPDDDPTDPGDKCDPNDPSSGDTLQGTYAASLLVAPQGDGVGLAGVAPKAKFMAVRVLGRCGGKLSDIKTGIRWAAGLVSYKNAVGRDVWNANKADIIVLPMGLFEPCAAGMQETIDEAVRAGALIVTSAGNARVDAKFYTPGGCSDVITVGASDRQGNIAAYSNFGAAIGLLAPGGDLDRDDDQDGQPDGIVGAKYSTNCADTGAGAPAICEYALQQGTTSSAMLAAGALALLKSKHPDEDNAALKQRLMTAVSPRTTLQCSGKCSDYPGAAPVPGLSGICLRACGAGLLDLSRAD